jgi:hypothetical protein
MQSIAPLVDPLVASAYTPSGIHFSMLLALLKRAAKFIPSLPQIRAENYTLRSCPGGFILLFAARAIYLFMNPFGLSDIQLTSLAQIPQHPPQLPPLPTTAMPYVLPADSVPRSFRHGVSAAERAANYSGKSRPTTRPAFSLLTCVRLCHRCVLQLHRFLGCHAAPARPRIIRPTCESGLRSYPQPQSMSTARLQVHPAQAPDSPQASLVPT